MKKKAATTQEMSDTKRHSLFLILAAAGSSTRMGTGSKKEYLSLNGGTVLSEAARIFLNTASFDAVVVTVPAGGEATARDAFFKDSISSKKESHTSMKSLLGDTTLCFVEGGNTRQQSVYKALSFLQNEMLQNSSSIQHEDAIVLIHDAARPYVTKKIITDVIETTATFGAAVPALTPVDTQKEISSDGTIERHLVRSNLAAVQTPQGFCFKPLFACHTLAAQQSKEYTDDTEIWDSFPEQTGGRKVHIVPGDSSNKKITYAQDIPAHDNFPKQGAAMIHTGFGTDLHKLVAGRKLMLGGVHIPFDKGELGHSDGDVLLHAITDALLGASGLGDIGSYFPPEEPQWKDADSAELLEKVWKDITDAGWKLCNLDCVVELEQPKFLPYRKQVISSIATILGVTEDQIFVKAKTNEKLEAVGAGEAVKAYCSCLLTRQAQA